MFFLFLFCAVFFFFFFSSRRRHTRSLCDWSSDVCSSDLASSRSKAIFPIAMATYRELLQQARSEISEIEASQARERIESGEPVVVDVREQDEWDEGHIGGALHVPRGHLESRIERLAPETSRPVIVYCSAGNRSAFAAKTLAELGYE